MRVELLLPTLFVYGGEEIYSAFFSRKVPRLSAAEMVHKRAVILPCGDPDLGYAGVDHGRQGKVDKAVTAPKAPNRYNGFRSFL